MSPYPKWMDPAQGGVHPPTVAQPWWASIAVWWHCLWRLFSTAQHHQHLSVVDYTDRSFAPRYERHWCSCGYQPAEREVKP